MLVCMQNTKAPVVPSQKMVVTAVQSDLSASGFRLAMSRLGAAVHIITTDGAAGRFGATATAVCSVSDAPPQLLICLNNRGRTLEAILQNGFFCTNVLSADDASIADVFAGRLNDQIADRFAVGEWTNSKCGSPLLLTSLASFYCEVIETKTAGTHTVVFGLVKEAVLGSAQRALMYLERNYRCLEMAPVC